MLLRFVVPEFPDLSTNAFSEDAVSLLLADLDRESGARSIESDVLGSTATEEFVTERLVPLLAGAKGAGFKQAPSGVETGRVATQSPVLSLSFRLEVVSAPASSFPWRAIALSRRGPPVAVRFDRLQIHYYRIDRFQMADEPLRRVLVLGRRIRGDQTWGL